MKKKFKKYSILLTLAIGFVVWQNNHIVISEYSYQNMKISQEFDGFTIVQVSDLHNKNFVYNQSYLVHEIEKLSPDIIVITGDVIDRRRFDLQPVQLFLDKAKEIAPIYYVSGNHEAWSDNNSETVDLLVNNNVNILQDQAVQITKNEQSINLIGIEDPDMLTQNKSLEILTEYSESQNLNILLAHRPENIEIYKSYNMDLVFSGHAHGGQVRLPFIGGIIAPNQGFLPKYDAGRFDEDGTTMIASKGLGNSLAPIRVFNRPELVVVKLSAN